MKKTFNVDDELLAKAKSACGAATDAETIRLGLEALAQRDKHEQLRSLLGREKPPSSKRKAEGQSNIRPDLRR
jgi:Bacterial antitoxin of type II TA system, VapB